MQTINFLPSEEKRHVFKYIISLIILGILFFILWIARPHSEVKIPQEISKAKTSKDESIDRGYFLNVPLQELRLVGVLLEKDKKWAFIEQKKGLVQKLTIQDTIGNPSQRIAVISLQFLQLAQEGKVYKTIAVGEKFA